MDHGQRDLAFFGRRGGVFTNQPVFIARMGQELVGVIVPAIVCFKHWHSANASGVAFPRILGKCLVDHSVLGRDICTNVGLAIHGPVIEFWC